MSSYYEAGKALSALCILNYLISTIIYVGNTIVIPPYRKENWGIELFTSSPNLQSCYEVEGRVKCEPSNLGAYITNRLYWLSCFQRKFSMNRMRGQDVRGRCIHQNQNKQFCSQGLSHDGNNVKKWDVGKFALKTLCFYCFPFPSLYVP